MKSPTCSKTNRLGTGSGCRRVARVEVLWTINGKDHLLGSFCEPHAREFLANSQPIIPRDERKIRRKETRDQG
jgi:hypothetical protein